MNMLSLYILIWPMISTGILALLVISLFRDIMHARKHGLEMI